MFDGLTVVFVEDDPTVLAGMIGAMLAQGLGPMEAAAGAAWVHGRAATVGAPVGLVASDLLGLVPRVIEEFL